MNHIRIFANGSWHTLDNTIKFSGGELHVNVKSLPDKIHDVYIKARVQSADDLLQLRLVGDALQRKYGNRKFPILIPYLPYARQDRVCGKGDALSIAVLGSILAPITTRIYTFDMHSVAGEQQLYKAGIELISKSTVEIFQYNTQLSNMVKNNNLLLVSPDKGAVNKTRLLADAFDISEKRIITCLKERSPSDGSLTGFNYSSHIETVIEGKDLLVVDDICDGGWTFTAIGEMLRELNPRSMTLYVTHGIFAKGFEALATYYNKIYTTDSFKRGTIPPTILSIIKV